MRLSRPTATPCRLAPSGPRHACSLEHVAFVEAYREARAVWLDARDDACIGYPTEEAEFAAASPSPTLAGFMRSARR